MSRWSARELTVFEYVKWFIEVKGYSPTVREIAVGIYYSPSVVSTSLSILEARGAITRDTRLARTIRLTGENVPRHEYG